jgi:hypothetical protein
LERVTRLTSAQERPNAEQRADLADLALQPAHLGMRARLSNNAPTRSDAAQPAPGEIDRLLELAGIHLQPVVSGAAWHRTEVFAAHLAFFHKPPGHKTLRTETINDVSARFPLTGTILRRRDARAIKRRVEKPGFARARDDGSPHPLQQLARRLSPGECTEAAAYTQCVSLSE